MFRKRILLLFLLLFSCANLFAAVFVVTNNADSGPGTLREALTLAAANGSAVPDIINFSFSDVSIAGRTITTLTNLPDLSANLTIDGTTQPGIKFGISDAKVKIVNIFSGDIFAPYYVFKGDNIGNLSIRGLWIDGSTPIDIDQAGVVVIDHCLIQEGETTIDDCQQFIFKNNMSGYLPNGITGQSYFNRVIVTNTPNTIIGGSASEGNLISGVIRINYTKPDKEWIYLISNNKLGSDYTGTSSNPDLYGNDGRIVVTTENSGSNYSNLKNMHGTITDNLVVNFSTVGIYVFGLGDVSIKGNSINTDKTGSIDFSQFYPDYAISLPPGNTGILLEGQVRAVIGGDNPSDVNTIAYIKNGILEQLASSVTITQNSIFCLTANYYNIHGFVAYPKPLPTVKILNFTNNTVSGLATPGARVELFTNAEGQCPFCGAKTFFAYTIADNTGKWSYTGLVPPNIVASAIYNNQTSFFTEPEIDLTNLTVTQPNCGDNTGAINGVKAYNTNAIKWINQNGTPVSEGLNITNLLPGKYKLVIGSGSCGAQSDWIELVDNSVKINASFIHIQNPACNQHGSISGLTILSQQNESFTYLWTDENSNIAGNSLIASDLLPGRYTLKVTGNTTGCSSMFGPVVLTNTTGPNIDESTKIVQTTPCGQTAGSINNITVTGTNPKYSWKNELGQEVAITKDLTGQPAGKYTLHVTDDTQCGPVYSSPIEIPETNGITLNVPASPKTDASCNKANGSVIGIIAPGATKFEWRDANNNLRGTDPDLKNVPAGAYQLTASNDFGCSKTSQVYQIMELPGITYPAYTITRKNTCFSETNGSISVTADAMVKSLRWVNGLDQTITGNQQISGLAAGTYKLYFTDQNDCESLYGTYIIDETPQLQIVAGSEQKTDDECDLKTGSIKNIQITGGLQPYTYEWYNANNEQVSTGISLSGLSAGNYKLVVNDASGCGQTIANYSIAAHSSIIAAPAANNVQLCTPGNALLTVNSAVANYTYRLYESVNSIAPLAEQTNGRFTINAKTSTAFYISQVSGSCESSRTEVQVAISLSAINIANTITPNGDGINDYWKIDGIENYPNGQIQVFNRYGQKVFESKGYPQPFNGTFNSKPLPNGAYYYIINLNKNCTLLSGSLTIIR